MKQLKIPRAGRGFTLIELMIVVAIVALLATVAYPSYAAHVRRGKIAVALSELTTVRVRMEQYYQDNRSYGPTAGTTCGVGVPSADSFAFSCATSNTGQSFLITATGGRDLAGYVYTINDADVHGTSTFNGVAVNKTCWIKKPGENC